MFVSISCRLGHRGECESDASIDVVLTEELILEALRGPYAGRKRLMRKEVLLFPSLIF